MKTKLDITKLFLDRPAVIQAVDRAALKGLSRAGGKMRLIAQRSMRYASQSKSGKPRKVSAPGEPPRAVRAHPWLRKHLYYAWDPATKSVVVGPAIFGRATGAPRRLEKGGRTKIRNRRRIVRKVGDGGEILVGLPSGIGDLSKTAKPAADWHGQTQWVTYAKLRTEAQARRANQLNELLYGPAEFEAQIEPRPYMGPTLDKMLPALPQELAGTVRP